MDNMWPVVIGGAIGIVGGVAGPMCLEWWKSRAERLSLSGAIVSEIAAILAIIQTRNYIEGLHAEIVRARATPAPTHIPTFFHFSVRRNPFAVYDANLSRIGILPNPMPRQIVSFYVKASAILEDIADMREGKIQRAREDSIHCLEELVKLFEETRALGQKIIADEARWRETTFFPLPV
jgi:hypothetical protein